MVQRTSKATRRPSKQPLYAWQQKSVAFEASGVENCLMCDKIKSRYCNSNGKEYPEMTPLELFKPTSILKNTTSPDAKFKNGRVLTWSNPLIEVREYDMSARATASHRIERQKHRKQAPMKKFLIFLCGAMY